jgi:uncharacterized protein YegL
MNDDLVIRMEELVSNPTARVPVCLCLDTSGSMNGTPIKELNEGVRTFIDELKKDEVAKYSAEVCVVTFGDHPKTELDFASLMSQNIPTLGAYGNTPMGKGVELALDLLDKRKREYAEAGVDYYQPWLVLMTDGVPTDSIDDAVKRTLELINNRKLTIFPIAIGSSADMSVLKMFSPARTPLRLNGLNFSDFFSWLSKSVSRVSQSIPGQEVPLDEEGIKGWASL